MVASHMKRGGYHDSSTGEEAGLVTEDSHKSSFILQYSHTIARIWGLVTCIVIWTCVLKTFLHMGNYLEFMKYYLVSAVIIVSIFEFIWMPDYCKCWSEETQCWGVVWAWLMLIDSWRKTVLYLLSALPCLIFCNLSWDLIVPGLMMISLAFAYFLTMFRDDEATYTSGKSMLGGLAMPVPQVVPYEVQTQTTEYYSQRSYAYDATGRSLEECNGTVMSDH